LNGEDIAFVGDFDDLCPDETIESNAILVDYESSGSNSDSDQLAIYILPAQHPVTGGRSQRGRVRQFNEPRLRPPGALR